MAFVKLAVRNILRHRRRALLTGLMICIGTFASTLTISYGQSVERALSRAVIETTTGDLAVHGYFKGRVDILEPQAEEAPLLKSASSLEALVARDRAVAAVAPRLRFNGLLATESLSSGVTAIGVDPAREKRVSPKLKVVEGTYLDRPDGILLAKSVAKALKVGVGQDLVLLASNPDGYMNAFNFRVQGIVVAQGMEMFLNRVVYVDHETARRLLRLPADTTAELAVALKAGEPLRPAVERLRREVVGAGQKLRVDPWTQLAAIPYSIIQGIKLIPEVGLAILLLVVAVGIINTVLMSVLERTREIGTMMALGTKRLQVLGILLLETVLLGIVAGGIGLVLGSAVILYLGRAGLPAFVQAMEFGFAGKRLYFVYDWPAMLGAFAGVVLLGVLAALVPVRVATRLNPVEALRRN